MFGFIRKVVPRSQGIIDNTVVGLTEESNSLDGVNITVEQPIRDYRANLLRVAGYPLHISKHWQLRDTSQQRRGVRENTKDHWAVEVDTHNRSSKTSKLKVLTASARTTTRFRYGPFKM